MSRIGNKVIVLPAGVEITNNDNVITVKGPKGELTREFSKDIEIRVEGTEVTLHRPNDSKEMKTIHGTTRALLSNMVAPGLLRRAAFFRSRTWPFNKTRNRPPSAACTVRTTR